MALIGATYVKRNKWKLIMKVITRKENDYSDKKLVFSYTIDGMFDLMWGSSTTNRNTSADVEILY